MKFIIESDWLQDAGYDRIDFDQYFYKSYLKNSMGVRGWRVANCFDLKKMNDFNEEINNCPLPKKWFPRYVFFLPKSLVILHF